MLKRLALIAWATALLKPGAAGLFSAQLRPLASYNYGTGSHDYWSQSGTGGLQLRLKNGIRFSGLYTLSADSDYSLLQNGTLRLKKSVRRDFDLSAGLNLSGGRFRDDSGDYSAAAFELGGTGYFGRNGEWTVAQRLTRGKYSFTSLRQVEVTRRSRSEIVTIEEGTSTSYTAYTPSARTGIEWIAKLYTSLSVSITAYSDRSPSYSQSLEASYRLPKGFELGSAWTLTQSSDSSDRRYLDFFLTKTF